MATVPSALRKQLDAADKCFADGNLKSAKMHADMAAALFGSAPEAQRAQAAYKVHAAASASKAKPDHYAVLGVKLNGGKPNSTTHEAVRKQHKELCGLLGPAKDSSAAVAAAYKLVDEAFAALTDFKKREVAAASVKPSPLLRQQQAAGRKAQKQHEQQEEAEEEDDDYYGGSGRRRRGQKKH